MIRKKRPLIIVTSGEVDTIGEEAAEITNKGVEMFENPDQLTQQYSITLTDSSNININLNSPNSRQCLNSTEIPEELTLQIGELIEAMKSNNSEKSKEKFSFLADKAADYGISLAVIFTQIALGLASR